MPKRRRILITGAVVVGAVAYSTLTVPSAVERVLSADSDQSLFAVKGRGVVWTNAALLQDIRRRPDHSVNEVIRFIEPEDATDWQVIQADALLWLLATGCSPDELNVLGSRVRPSSPQRVAQVRHSWLTWNRADRPFLARADGREHPLLVDYPAVDVVFKDRQALVDDRSADASEEPARCCGTKSS